jgi:hypothetical protein
MIVAASTMLLADSRSGRAGGVLPWTLMVVGSVASLAANVAVAVVPVTAWAVAKRAREELPRRLQEGRQPRTNASLMRALLAASPVQRRSKQTQQGYIGPLLGERSHDAPGDHAAALVGHAAGAQRLPQPPQTPGGHRALAEPAAGQQPNPPGTPHAQTAANRDLLTLERMRTQADPDDLDALQLLILDALRHADGDRSRIGEYETNIPLAGPAETLATGVVA